MATEKKSNTLAQIGPVAAPLIGVVLAIIFIALALLTSSVSDSSEELTKAVGATRKKLDDTTVTPDTKDIPLADNVVNSFARKGSNNWSVNEGNKGLLALPIKWEVVMDAPVGDPFQVADENGDGNIDLTEWGRSDFPTRPGSQGKFENWDRNPKDDQISRTEFNDPPQNEREAFDKLKKNDDDDVLTVKDGEITTEQVFAWDSYPFEGEISFEEYEARFKPKQERGLGPVGDVQAKVDAATMEIVVTWKDPEIADKPEDLSFMILRRAPENRAKRQKEYSKKAGAYDIALRAWDSDFSKWWNDATADADGKTNKQKWPKKGDAEKEFAKSNRKPVPPEQVSDWEMVTVNGPITGNEYRDKNFDTDVTYTYAVYMGTQKKPKREQRVRPDTEAAYPDWFFYADNQVAAGHPVLVRNHISMGWEGAAGDVASISLTKWFKHEETATWYRIRIVETIQPDSILGGDYRVAQLKERKVSFRDVAGADVAPEVAEGILPTDNTTINFTTGLEYILGKSAGFVLNSSVTGDVILPKASKAPAKVPQGTAASDDALEVRCLGVKEGAKEATFELTRWTKVADRWFRVVMVSTVKNGAEVGGEVDLSKPGADVKVWDDAGAELKAADIKALKDVKVNLKAGTFDGLEERDLTVGGDKVDLFGILYKG